ncbi:MAG: hypothetical protein HFJ37_02570 [Clostridia bacterium]|nr:hypothetical protein [Clostridia bacterium]
MARNRYEYGTSPRKLQPNVRPQKQTKRRNLKVVKDLPRQEIKISKEQKKKQIRLTISVAILFILLLTISYRNSQINEKFNEVQRQKKELSLLQKENEQLKVNIENGLNLNNIEKLAKEKLGMQKLTNKQTLYVTLPKKDYIESASKEVVMEKSESWFEEFIHKIFHK